LPVGTTVSMTPGDVAIAQTNEFVSKIVIIGTRFLPTAGEYAVVVAAPGFISQTQTVSAAGIQDGGHVSFSFTQAHSLAPNSLAGLSFDYAAAGTIALSTNGQFYTWITPGGAVETGFYSASRAGSVWTVRTDAVDGLHRRNVQFDFNSPDSGSLAIVNSDSSRDEMGSFTRSVHPELPPGLTPPPVIHTMWIRTDPNSLIGEQAYKAEFAGSLFTFVQGGANGLAGPFEYSGTGADSAHLRLWYTGPYTGDYDDITLTFTAPGTGRISGTSKVNSSQGIIVGRFSFAF
jgi:hypothetical protein